LRFDSVAKVTPAYSVVSSIKSDPDPTLHTPPLNASNDSGCPSFDSRAWNSKLPGAGSAFNVWVSKKASVQF